MQRRAGGEAPPESPTAAAFYIGTLTEELAQMARRHGLESLRYIFWKWHAWKPISMLKRCE